MARSVLVDTGFLVALLRKRDERQPWAVIQATAFPPPWLTCEAVLSETYHLLEEASVFGISAMLQRGVLTVSFQLTAHLDPVLTLIKKYSDVPMALADACLVRMTEVLDQPVVLTTDEHFRVYRRHSRRVVPCVLPV